MQRHAEQARQARRQGDAHKRHLKLLGDEEVNEASEDDDMSSCPSTSGSQEFWLPGNDERGAGNCEVMAPEVSENKRSRLMAQEDIASIVYPNCISTVGRTTGGAPRLMTT